MKNKKNIEIRGSFYNNNFGDLLLLWSTSFAVMNSGCNYATNTIPKNILKLARVEPNNTKNIDAVIYGGGGYLGETGKFPLILDLRRDIRYNIPGIIYRLKNIPYAVIGAGGGRIVNPITRFLLNQFLSGANYIALRDKESIDYLPKIKNINLIGDAILCLSELNYPLGNVDQRINDFTKNKISIGLHLTSTERMPINKEIFNILNKKSLENKNIRFVALTDQIGESSSNLRLAQKEAINCLGKEICVFNEYEDPWDFVEIIKNLDIVITNKLHVGIVALSFGKKVIATPTMPKTHRYYKGLGLSHLCLDSNSNDFIKNFDKLISSYLLDDDKNSYKVKVSSIELSKKYYTDIKNFLDSI